MALTTAIAAATIAGVASDQAPPSRDVTVERIKGTPANTWFQHIVVQLGLEAFGYEVEETREADFPAVHLAVASGDASYFLPS